MLGALAWQATVIKMFFCVPGGVRTGVILFSPGFSPPSGVPCVGYLRLHCDHNFQQRSRANLTWSYSARTKTL
uniref:Secreted protein n=1 Tax=Oryza brachyantha TaxID=4533 RepID=J3LLL2_ORYBR